MKVIMVNVIDSLMYSSSLSRLGPLIAKRTKTSGKFKVNEESDSSDDDAEEISEVQSKPFIKSLSLLKLNQLSQSQESEMVSYGEDLLSHLQDLQCHLLLGEISYEDLEVLDKTFKRLPGNIRDMSSDLQDIVNNIQVRVAVELAKLHNKRS